MKAGIFLLLGCLAARIYSAAPKPHIIWTLIDDWGHADLGIHDPHQNVETPNFDNLFQTDGMEMGHHYVHQVCSPTRSSVLTGRLPVHCNVDNGNMMRGPPVGDICAGAPRNMTMIAAKMREAGYQTHAVGKFDAGMCSFESTPKGRGFDSSLIYFQHANDYYDSVDDPCNKTGMVDLWHHSDLKGIPEGPAYDVVNPTTCNPDLPNHPYPVGQPSCIYEDEILAEEVFSILRDHDPSKPLFLYYTPHIVHEPLMVPKAYYDKFASVEHESRRRYLAMVSFVDTIIGNLTSMLKEKGMWENTLWMGSADNGGPIYEHGLWPSNQTWYAGANNFPLRGGKVSNWEGGIRVNSWISGGFLPPSRRGTVAMDLSSSFDWYATSCALAGVDPTDARAEASGLPPIDSINLWPWLSGKQSRSPRTSFEVGQFVQVKAGEHNHTLVQGIIDHRQQEGTMYKLVIGELCMDTWQGPNFPNATSHIDPGKMCQDCGNDGCLFELLSDPTEHVNLAKQHPEVRVMLRDQMHKAQANAFQPNRGSHDSPQACEAATTHWKGFWGPWIGVVGNGTEAAVGDDPATP